MAMLLTFIIILVIFIYILSNKRYKWLYIIAKTCKRDYRGKKLLNFTEKKYNIIKKYNLTIHKVFSETVKNYSDKVAIIFEEKQWTFTMMDEYSNKVANYFNIEGFKKGDCIGLLYDNQPEYVCVWLGLSKLGVCCALFNTNLRDDSLIYFLGEANCRGLLFGSTYAEHISRITDRMPHIRLYQLRDLNPGNPLVNGAIDLENKFDSTPTTAIEIKKYVNSNDPLLYICTSGTTGTPKAAVFSHAKFLTLATMERFFLQTDDIIYHPLPLYHAFGVMGLAMTITSGVTVVIKKKFSASQYWSDCAKYYCTIAIYTGEMCRYTLSIPTIEVPTHKIRAIFGIGLKQDIWNKLVKKFRINQVLEFYSTTESVIMLVNIDNKVGAVGFIPRCKRWSHSIQLVRYNEETKEPVRMDNGLCVVCEIGEPGLALSKIGNDDILTFHGYTDKEYSRRKIVKNVLEIEDAYFNSEDILVTDELGYVYFKDRIADSFRWKGKTVSTYEVESIISKLLQNITVIVFGVEVPGTDGKAGMAVIVDIHKIVNITELSELLVESLPNFAVPLFIRLSDNLPVTSTYKINKKDLKVKGYNLDRVNDPIYFFDASLQQYVSFSKKLHEDILQRRIRF